jgi:hypothetical protein
LSIARAELRDQLLQPHKAIVTGRGLLIILDRFSAGLSACKQAAHSRRLAAMPFSTDPLSSARAQIQQLVCDHAPSVAEEMLLQSRSHIATLVRNLPANPLKLLYVARAILPNANGAAAAALAAASASEASIADTPPRAQDAVMYADIAMIFGAPPAAMLPLIAIAETELRDTGGLPSTFPTVERISTSVTDCNTPVLSEDASYLSVDRFRTDYFRVDRPVKICGAVASWPAVRRWRDPQFLATTIGHRTVPVEITNEGEDKMREEFVPVRRVLELMASDASSSTGSMYMAQHPLSTYMPVLRSDFEVPVWTVAAGEDAKDNTVINFWLGSSETGSRLHFDSQDNFLVQAVGRKRVTLFGADQTPFLHVDDEAVLNFSPVNVDSPDLTVHNQFGNAVGRTAILNPGDALYIPAGVWHWVRCIEPSISVNFWF